MIKENDVDPYINITGHKIKFHSSSSLANTKKSGSSEQGSTF